MRTWHFYFFLLLYFSDFSIAICKWIVKRYLTFFGSFCEFCLVSEISKKNLQLFTCTPHEIISYLFHEFSMYKNIQSSRGKKILQFFRWICVSSNKSTYIYVVTYRLCSTRNWIFDTKVGIRAKNGLKLDFLHFLARYLAY